MSITRSLRNFYRAICRALGVTTAGAAPDGPASAATSSIARQPAVAGFIRRLTLAERFLLARRLASIARLNVPAGRKPFGCLRRSQGLPPVPSARLGAKKTRLDANKGPRILRPARPVATTATIIPFTPAQAKANRQLSKAA